MQRNRDARVSAYVGNCYYETVSQGSALKWYLLPVASTTPLTKYGIWTRRVSAKILAASHIDVPRSGWLTYEHDIASDSFALDFELPTIPGTQRQDPPANGQPSGEDKSPRFDVTLSVDAQIDVSGVGFSVSCGEKVLAEKRIAHP